MPRRSQSLTAYSPTNSSPNCPMTCSPSESTHLFHKNASFDTELTRGSSHELYIYANTLDMYHNFAPKFPGRYLTSNVNITVPGPDGSPISVPVGSQLQLGRDRTHFLMICLIRRSLRQVQDTKVSCMPRNDAADKLSSRVHAGAARSRLLASCLTLLGTITIPPYRRWKIW